MSLEFCDGTAEGLDTIKRRVIALQFLIQGAQHNELLFWNHVDAESVFWEATQAILEAVEATEKGFLADLPRPPAVVEEDEQPKGGAA